MVERPFWVRKVAGSNPVSLIAMNELPPISLQDPLERPVARSVSPWDKMWLEMDQNNPDPIAGTMVICPHCHQTYEKIDVAHRRCFGCQVKLRLGELSA